MLKQAWIVLAISGLWPRWLEGRWRGSYVRRVLAGPFN